MVLPRPLPSPLLAAILSLIVLLLTHQASGIKCVQCEAAGSKAPCSMEPPSPTECGAGMSVCLTIHTYTPSKEDSRKMLSLVRTCAPTDMGWDCKTGRTKGGQEVEVCHDTCDWDGCNPAPATLPALPLLASLLGALLLL
ncbi:uncharacterized protein LOC127001789 [Eriocheir sinensis]|uniref:uncharacterized protein LOC127001789 n=1 Tax=Eriocheir sinensis TaxID=95602 RepID=UPI0021C7F6BB|nr:uncharacterized protein LOC127001789 [Eriocheir sinensis]